MKNIALILVEIIFGWPTFKNICDTTNYYKL
jgi:hypothetical protein